ncbi:coiled-coil and C2 domain-containing protein 2A [Anoplophora glabripennis]|uniref:coiled-coil and C2 domain-containing protein 2A n=1 Tax=Anoplophora glabripennis TaxID=217634 RepID=UPI000C78DB67|nr:coiled-coil and C2 domain-containing protein 2A [Anoplophora glabripennis]
MEINDPKSPIIKDKCNEIVIIKENILEIYLAELKFTHHPLFSLEHVLAVKLCNLYDQYSLCIKNNTTDRVKTQLEALRYLRQNMGNRKVDEGASKRIRKVDRDIQKVRKVYFEERRKERENLKDILNTWKQIKKIREKQKFSNTNIKLLIKKEKLDYETDRTNYNREFDETFCEMIKENKDDKKTNFTTNEDIRKDLDNIFQQSFRAPGEPVLKLSLSENHEITETVEDSKEVSRRNSVRSTKMYLNILCDKVPVCKSKAIDLSDDFLLNLKETFAIQLQKVPKCLNIEVIEQQKGLATKKICEIIIMVPTQNFSSVSSKPIKTTFEVKEIVHHKHAGIGSGTNLKKALESVDLTLLNSNYDLTTTGYIKYFVGWQKKSVIRKDPLGEQIELLKDITNKNLSINIGKLSEWMGQSVPDPQDPRNVVFFEYMASCEPKLFKNNNFRLSPYMEDLKFCDLREIDQNIRFKILHLRDQNETEFDGVVIPNRIKEIPFNTLDIIKRHKLEEHKYITQTTENEIDTQENHGRKYLKQIYKKLFQICKSSDNNLVYESVVDEKYLAHFEVLLKTVLKNFFNWFHWKPNAPISIKPKTPLENEPQEHHNLSQQYNITIKIISAKNVPSRNKSTFNKHSLSGSEISKAGSNENEVKPFVEVSYENISIRTNSSSGLNPVWNDTLTIPLEYQNIDYLNPESLNGTITVNLYDEYDSMLKHQNKKHYSWLGAVEIPLSAVCYSTSMSGLFKVKLAQLLLGYETEAEKHISKSPKINNLHSHYHHTYIQMELSTTPNVPKLIINMESMPCNDLPYIQQHVVKWNLSYNDGFPARKFSALAVDTNAKTTCITRYLKPLEPPQINLEEFDVTAEQCLRYVSLIPFTECSYFYHNVWLTTNELLHFMIGSITDHAVALTCYLLALKMEAWLLVGYGIPHGSTAYVFTREYVKDTESPTYYIYDVYYNEKYNITDPYCPLQKIYCLANGENVWANTQKGDSVQLTRLDLTRRSDWLALFNNNIGAPTHFVNNKIIYKTKVRTERLENHIEVQIRKKISKLRQLDRTIWNRNLSSDFKNVLRSFEINYMYNKNHYETINELYEKFTSYAVTGYIINSSYLNISTILNNLRKLGICGQESNEFALAVYIHIYPGPLLSVWVFIGNIINKIDV